MVFASFYKQLTIIMLDEVEQNIVICQRRADQSFAKAEG